MNNLDQKEEKDLISTSEVANELRVLYEALDLFPGFKFSSDSIENGNLTPEEIPQLYEKLLACKFIDTQLPSEWSPRIWAFNTPNSLHLGTNINGLEYAIETKFLGKHSGAVLNQSWHHGISERKNLVEGITQEDFDAILYMRDILLSRMERIPELEEYVDQANIIAEENEKELEFAHQIEALEDSNISVEVDQDEKRELREVLAMVNVSKKGPITLSAKVLDFNKHDSEYHLKPKYRVLEIKLEAIDNNWGFDISVPLVINSDGLLNHRVVFWQKKESSSEVSNTRFSEELFKTSMQILQERIDDLRSKI